MEKKTTQEVLLEIYNETLGSLLRTKVNRRMYDNVKDDEDIVPKELVETGMRVQKKASQRKKELDEDIKTKEQMLKIVDGMIKDVEQGVETSE